jgi:tetrahydromethanopterin S-methyltransferase subunit B
MGLRATAAADYRTIINDQDTAMGWPISLTPPGAASVPLVGRSTDIHLVIDPDTGVVVSGRTASAVFCIQDILDAGLALPVGVVDATADPWLATFDDVTGVSHTFKVTETNPDRALGSLICILEVWKDAP